MDSPASTSPAAPGAHTAPSLSDLTNLDSVDLAAKGMDYVDLVVAVLRDKTVRPLTLVARGLIFGIIVLAAAVTTLTLLSVSLIRLLTVYLHNKAWLAQLIVGVVFVILGIVAWKFRKDPALAGEVPS